MRSLKPPSGGDGQRGFSEAVSRMKRLSTKATGAECCEKPFERDGAGRLGANESPFPIRQIDLRALLIRDLPDAQLVAEIGTCAHHILVSSDGAQPAQRLSHEALGSHDDTACAYVERLENKIDQPPIM